MTLTDPLWLLGLLPLAAWLALRLHGSGGPRAAWFAGLAALVVLALAGPAVPGQARSRHVAVVLDLSGSVLASVDVAVLHAGVERAVAGLRPRDTVSLVVAGPEPQLLLDTESVGDGVQWPALAPAGSTDAGTALAAALELALDRRPADVPAVVVLITDGRGTDGADALAAIALRAAAAGVPVLAVGPMPATVPDVGFVDAVAPTAVPPGRAFVVSATLSASAPARVGVAVTRNARAVDAPDMELRLGDQPVASDADGMWSVQPGGAYAVRVVCEAADNPGFIATGLTLRVYDGPNAIVANDRISAGTVVGTSDVLLVTPDGDSAFAQWLRTTRPDLPLRVIAPEAVPDRAADLLGHAAIILDGLPRDALPAGRAARFDAAVATAVEAWGAGLLMVGSRHAFGPGGWIDTAVDAVLPVDCDPNREVQTAVALVLDCSGSMAEGVKMPRVAGATLQLLDRLGPSDALALVEFRKVPEVVPLGPDAGRGFAPVTPATVAAVRSRLDRLVAARHVLLHGETDLYAGLARGAQLLATREADAKLLLALSDGEPTFGAHLTFDDAYRTLLDDAAADGAFTAVIATQPVARVPLFAQIADWLGRSNPPTGSVQAVQDLTTLPRAFANRLSQARGPLLAPPAHGGHAIAGVEGAGLQVPPLTGYARTRLRDPADATLDLTVGEDDPLLATRRVGAGRSAALLLPFDAPDLLGDGWRERLAQGMAGPVLDAIRGVVDMVTSSPPAAPWTASIETGPDGTPQLVVRLDPGASSATAWIEGPGLELALAATDTLPPTTLTLPAITPTRFAVSLPSSLDGLLIGQLRAPGGGPVSPVALSVPIHPEWRHTGRDAAALQRLTTLPDATAIEWLDRQAPPAGPATPLTPWLAMLTILLLLAGEAARVWRHFQPTA